MLSGWRTSLPCAGTKILPHRHPGRAGQRRAEADSRRRRCQQPRIPGCAQVCDPLTESRAELASVTFSLSILHQRADRPGRHNGAWPTRGGGPGCPRSSSGSILGELAEAAFRPSSRRDNPGPRVLKVAVCDASFSHVRQGDKGQLELSDRPGSDLVTIGTLQ